MAKSKRTAYSLGRPLERYSPFPIEAARAPTTADVSYDVGQIWVNTATGIAYILTAISSGSATWSVASPGASEVDTINSLPPTAGNILIDGGTNITDSNAGSTVTLNLDDAITLATSVTSPLYTSGAGDDLGITVPAGKDSVFKLGDNAAANKLSITDSDDSEVASIDSDGAASFAGNVVLSSVATQLQMNGGAATDFIGQATLVLGTVTVNNTNIADADKIFVQREGVAASTALGVLDVSITAATSFTITALQPGTPGSTETNDVSVVNYFIVRQN